MMQPARCPECRKCICEKQAEAACRDCSIAPLGLNYELQWWHGSCVKDGGQKLGTLIKKVGHRHEEQSNAD